MFLFELLPPLLRGTGYTVIITCGGAVLAVLLAFSAGLMRLSRFWIFRAVAAVYVDLFRGTSALVQLFWFFYALPLLGVTLGPVVTGILVLGLNTGSYGAEVVRGALRAVPKGQTEACRALNFTPFQRMRYVILPQAVAAMLPPWGNLFIELLKNTALVSLITVSDLTFQAQLVRTETLRTEEIFTVVLLLYFGLALAITGGMRLLERRFARAGGQVGPGNA